MAGDWNSSGNNNCGANNLGTSIKQSPNKPDATLSQFITVYRSRILQYDLSERTLRRISIQNGIKREFLYKRITDMQMIWQIERINYSKWVVQDVNLSKDYIILRQIIDDYHPRYTGYYKVVKMTNATIKQWATTRVDAKPEHWMYYGKG